MRSYGPKGLLRLSDSETILSRLVRQFRERWPDVPIFVSVGFEGDRIRRAGLDVNCVACDTFDITNVSESVRLILKEAPPGPFLLCLGDLVFSDNVIASLTLADPGVLWGECGLSRLGEVGLTVSADRRVGHLTHDLSIRWAQLAYLGSEERAVFEGVLGRPGAGRSYVYEALNCVLGKVPLRFDVIDGWVVEVDLSRDLALAKMAVHMDMGGSLDEVPY